MNDDNEINEPLLATPPEDDFSIRCPRLGHQINFPYCRSENNGLPCFKTLDCWYPHFNVHAYLKGRLTDEDFKKVFISAGKPKILSLFDLIEQAKKNKAAADKEEKNQEEPNKKEPGR